MSIRIRGGEAYSHRIPLADLKCVSENRRKEMANVGQGSATEVIDQPEEERKTDAEDEAGDDREIESSVFAAIDNVPREAAEAEGRFAAEVEKCTDENDKASEEEERAAEFAEGVHKKIVEETEKRSTYWKPCRVQMNSTEGGNPWESRSLMT
jgi:hypothetical protein